jgi:alkylhydroperoxidase AhpD family core domain
MQPRLNYWGLAPAVPGKLIEATALVEGCGLERRLLHLVNIRASQVNGCAFCLELHTREAREDGESENRLYALSAWDDSPLFSERERAALAWTEAVTHVSADRVSDEVWDRVRPHFEEAELAWLTYAVALINAWNRLAIAFKPVPGSWKKPKAAAST